tara:strand:- start:324 stop:782 length:459 start_codon:yes stop_codon:yes gene_type:complete
LLADHREDLRRSLIDLVEPVVEDCDAQLVDVELMGASNNPTIRILVHKDLGITISDCEQISREIADLLDIEDPISSRYRLEVTSPGLDRPLQSDGDFARAEGRLLRVVLFTGKTIRGRLTDWSKNEICLMLPENLIQLDRQDIAKATIEAEL